MSLFTRLVVALANWSPFQKMITGTRPGRALARRFVAGDSLDEAVQVAERLNGEGFSVSLDLLGEAVTDEAAATRATDEYIECLDRIESAGLNANISVKPTQLGLAIDASVALSNIMRLAEAARRVGTTVTIDMEDSRYTEATVVLFEAAQKACGNVGIALQACMRRNPADIARLLPLGGHIRLCKGAYVEPEEVAITSKAAVSQAYADQLKTLMASSSTKPAIASHDTSLVDLACQQATVRTEPFEFQMLFGVRNELQRSLVAQGYQLRVYLPFGSEWYPYLSRRLAERPSNLWFFIRALIGR